MKKLAILLGFLTAVFDSTALPAAEPPAAALNRIMTQVGTITVEIYPLIVAKRAFTPQEITRLDDALSQMSTLFSAAAPFIGEKADSYQISYEFISRYLDVVKTVLRTSDIDYARTHLYALGEICASCHTQDTTLRTLFSGTTRDVLPDDYAFAELNYITRDYDDAVKYYEKFLDSPGRKTELNIIQPLQRIITIYTQVHNDPRQAIHILEKYTSYKQHTPETLAELNNWISGLQELEASGVSKTPTVRFATLQEYVAKYLGDYLHTKDHATAPKQSTAKQEVQRVWLRGQLYHYLNKQPEENEIPMLLYWLAVIDRSIAYNFYFSLADLYLKQCVLKYPTHPYAQRCFAEYENYVDYTYVQYGEKIPPGIQLELVEMQKALRKSPSPARGAH